MAEANFCASAKDYEADNIHASIPAPQVQAPAPTVAPRNATRSAFDLPRFPDRPPREAELRDEVEAEEMEQVPFLPRPRAGFRPAPFPRREYAPPPRSPPAVYYRAPAAAAPAARNLAANDQGHGQEAGKEVLNFLTIAGKLGLGLSPVAGHGAGQHGPGLGLAHAGPAPLVTDQAGQPAPADGGGPAAEVAPAEPDGERVDLGHRADLEVTTISLICIFFKCYL